jgi:hypothetical protein
MPTISELTSVYTANISDLEAKHSKAMRMLEDFKRASGGASNPFAVNGALNLRYGIVKDPKTLFLQKLQPNGQRSRV